MAATSSVPTGVRLLAEYAELQGAWASEPGRREAKLLIAGNRYTFEFRGDVYMGSFTLDPHDVPKRIDMHVEEGPPEHKGLTAYCIYQRDGDALRWCPSKPGSPDRLYRFPTEEDSRYLSLIFRPIRPSRGG
jgi:uncharacterized protein (TIGR03067 family)